MKKVMTMLAMCAVTLAASAQTVDEKIAKLESNVENLQNEILRLREDVEEAKNKSKLIREQARIGKAKQTFKYSGERARLSFNLCEVKGYEEEGKIQVTVQITNDDNKVKLNIYDGATINVNTGDQYKLTTYPTLGGQTNEADISKDDTLNAVFTFTKIKGKPALIKTLSLQASIDGSFARFQLGEFKNIDIDWEE